MLIAIGRGVVMQAFYKTDQGKVRLHNEDNGGVFFKTDKCCLAIVADGMGGHNAGEIASRIAVQKLAHEWELMDERFNPEKAEKWLNETINDANKEIYLESLENEDRAGMGTTVVAAICSESFVTIANIGDSRCYLLNELGFKQLTEDHSLINELLKLGEISEEDAKVHPRKNLLMKALGTEDHCEVDIKTIICDEDDRLLLCSDGLSNKLTAEELEQILSLEKNVEEKANEYIQKANENGGEDNISVAIIDFTPHVESGCESC